jgi:Ca-activated chloride channel family protein
MFSSGPSRISITTSTLSCPRSPRESGLRSVCLGLIVAFVFPINLFAQQPASDDEILRVNTNLLVVPIRVRDKSKQTVVSLTERDLILKDEDHVTAGLYLKQGVDRVALVFALDQSGSTREIISQQRQAALALFERFGERSQVAVLHFAETALLVAPFGRDTGIASRAFIAPVAPNQHTAIFDAADAALKTLRALTPVQSERRIVILISDGLDNASRTKPASVSNMARQGHVSFYVIHLPLFEPRYGRLEVRPPAKGFKELAEKTGGKYFLVGDARSALAPREVDLKPNFQAIEDDLKSQYLLGFYFGEAATDERKYRLTVSLPAGFEYQIAGFKYSRSHEFFINRPAKR